MMGDFDVDAAFRAWIRSGPITWLPGREPISSLSFARSRGTYKRSLRAALQVFEERGERNNLSEDYICSTAGGKLMEREHETLEMLSSQLASQGTAV